MKIVREQHGVRIVPEDMEPNEWSNCYVEDTPLPTEEVEKVARAMYEAVPIAMPLEGERWSWDKMIAEKWALPDIYRDLAKAAMRALAKPDEGVVSVLQRARECIMMANHETGICCCGGAVESHGMGDGHSPVDEGSYYMQGTLESIDRALSSLSDNAGVR